MEAAAEVIDAVLAILLTWWSFLAHAAVKHINPAIMAKRNGDLVDLSNTVDPIS